MNTIKYTTNDLIDHDAIAAVIKNDQGEILMQKHVKYGFWTIPVGKVKQGQSVEDGLKQEVNEECNIVVEDCEEIAHDDRVYERDGKMVNVLLHLFLIKKYSGGLKNNEPQKHRKQEFLEIEAVKRLPYLSDSTILYLKSIGIERMAKL
ncbi:MAG: NUDIX domain-containing protein [Parcubacteria group bacterium]